LLEPIELAGRTVRSRVLFGPHETNLARGRALSDRHVAYYARRARGGVGLIVTEDASVHPLDWPYERAPLAADCGPGWEAIAAACHAEGAAVVASLNHAGMQGSSAYSQRELWAPSRVPHAVSRELPKEMEARDITDVIGGFAAAARLAVGSGLDGVELNAGQHSLIRQFLSGLTNQRGDEWADRLAFARAVIGATRNAIGADHIVGLRLSCDELAPWAGITPDAAAEIAAALAPEVDYLVVVRGSIYSAEATTPDTHQPAGFNLDLVGQMRAAVDGACPVVAQGSIVDWGQAEWALDDGRADMVEMTRAQIADPDLVAKLVAGEGDRIRPCLRCNQRCRVRDARNPIVSCVVNPTAGFESSEAETATPAAQPLTVHIVGAGPAGLEAARVAAAAGHTVHVYDRAAQTGGEVAVWTEAVGREPLRAIVGWLTGECERTGVQVHLGHAVDHDTIAHWLSVGDEVILATGSVARTPEYQVSDGASLVGALELLAGADLADGPVVVWDPIGGPIAVSVAETLATQGRPVTVVTPDPIVATLLSLTGDLAPANTRLLQQGVTLVKRHRLRAVEADRAVVADVFSGATTELEAAVVVDCGHRLPAPSLAAEGGAITTIGDAVAPRTIYEAILEGRRAGVAVASAARQAVH
jgi:mycofactocin system FadH/OYE family oxidoreductase 1